MLFNDLKRLWKHIKPARRQQLVWLLLLMLVGALAELVSIGAIIPFVAVLSNPQQAIESVWLQGLMEATNTPADSVGVLVSVIFAVAVVASVAVRLLLLRNSNRWVFGVGYDLGINVFSKTLHRPYIWHVSKNSSEVIAGLGKVQGVVNGFLLPVINSFVALVMALSVVFTLLVVDPYMAIVGAGVFTGAYFVIAVLVRRRIAQNGVITSNYANQRIKETQESLGGIRDVIIDSTQDIYVDRFAKVDAKLRQAQASNMLLGSFPRLAIEGVGLLILAGFALHATSGGGLTNLLPSLAALGLGAQKLMPLIQTLYTGWAAVTAGRAAMEHVLSLIEIDEPDNSKQKICFDEQIKLTDVSYKYSTLGTQAPALKSINLEIKKGQVVGVVGKTGSGKSTLVDLLMGLLPPTEGTLSIDGVELKTGHQMRGWMANIAHVPQVIYLSDASLAENIAFGVSKEKIDKERMVRAAKIAQIHDHIQSLEKGYETDVGERGVRLSGGQRQRIGIARALYKKSSLLVLDEATSALDDGTEKLVISAIHDEFPNLTIVMVAHRLTTLRNCDSVVKLGRGRVEDLVGYLDLVK